jgi:hypothetical protein
MPHLARQVIAVVSVGMVLTGALSAQAVSENPYKDIVVRNAFALLPPPPPVTNAPPPVEEAPSNIAITGITSIGGRKEVYLTLTTPGEKEPKYIRLSENEREGAIEVTKINLKAGAVNIKSRGIASTITFEKNGAKSNVAAAPAAKPGVAGIPGAPGVPPVPGVPAAPTSTVANPSATTIVPGSTGGGQPRPTNTTLPTTTEQPGTRTIPTRPLRITPNGGGTSSTTPAAPNINPAVQAVQIEVNRNTQPANFPPLPPTPLSSN